MNNNKCEKRLDEASGGKWFICDRCESLWPVELHNGAWIPFNCANKSKDVQDSKVVLQ